MNQSGYECGSLDHWNRRTLLKAAGLSGLAWLTPVSRLLAEEPASTRQGRPAKSIILLWLSGGPSQLETFDPQAGSIAAGTRAIKTSVKGIEVADNLPRVAEEMHEISIVRNVVSREGDHERAAYHVKTGYRPDPTLVHPSMGAIVCHELEVGKTEIPRHISILPDQWYGRGGFLGQQYDAFKAPQVTGDLPDLKPRVDEPRFQSRLDDLQVVERSFRKGRLERLEDDRTQHLGTIDRAVTMMNSEQLRAFSIEEETRQVRTAFGESEFGAACLAAVRLIEVGVRCVEVTLRGWDTHINNHDFHRQLTAQLDPAFAATIRLLKERDRLKDTLVVCGGEFGRTPTVNPAGGRDHWPHGFSIALAGGSLRKGHVVGETDPEGGRIAQDAGTAVADVHATILKSLGITPERELDTPIGRPMKLSEGQPIQELLA